MTSPEPDRRPPFRRQETHQETAMPPRSVHPPSTLDDAIGFAHEVYSALGGTDVPLTTAAEAAFVPFQETVAKLAALVGEQPAATRLLNDLEDMFVTLGTNEQALGTELGVAAEQLRQALIAARAGQPRIPWRTT